jgi:hypothetical protein
MNHPSAKAGTRLNYPTQKPEYLIECITKSTTDEGDVIADFFGGSGYYELVPLGQENCRCRVVARGGMLGGVAHMLRSRARPQWVNLGAPV